MYDKHVTHINYKPYRLQFLIDTSMQQMETVLQYDLSRNGCKSHCLCTYIINGRKHLSSPWDFVKGNIFCNFSIVTVYHPTVYYTYCWTDHVEYLGVTGYLFIYPFIVFIYLFYREKKKYVMFI